MTTEELSNPSKHVAESVDRLLTWNDTYKTQVESVANRISELGRLTAASTSDYAQVAEIQQNSRKPLNLCKSCSPSLRARRTS